MPKHIIRAEGSVSSENNGSWLTPPCWHITGEMTGANARAERSLPLPSVPSAEACSGCRAFPGGAHRVCSYNKNVAEGKIRRDSVRWQRADKGWLHCVFHFPLSQRHLTAGSRGEAGREISGRRAMISNNLSWKGPDLSSHAVPCTLSRYSWMHTTVLVSLDSLCEKCTILHF